MRITRGTAPGWLSEVDVQHGNITKRPQEVQGSREVEVEEGQYLIAINLRLASKSPALVVTEYTELRTRTTQQMTEEARGPKASVSPSQ
jgi:hypothetical protein